MSITAMLLLGLAAMSLMQLLLYLFQRARRDATIVDAGWAFGIGLLALFYAVVADGDPRRRLLLAVLAGLWSFRLTGHLMRRVLAPEEDGRYRMLREKWGEKAQAYFAVFFQVQAGLSVLFSIPLLVVARNPQPAFTVWDGLGVLVWVVAVAGESTADAQLARFLADPANRGKTCDRGLWRYSRHPNYFFEWLHWWAYVFLAVGAPWSGMALAGPALMLLFLYKLTGIPYTEQRALASRGENYREYQRRTSAFIPWFPKEGR